MNKPNFLIIGAAKSGTTSLYQYLSQHPDVFMSKIKEPHFFALEGNRPDYRGPGDAEGQRFRVTDWDSYLKLFDNSEKYRVRGEASTLYLYHPNAPVNIHKYIPEVKMIVVLRNPLDAAYSAFCHMYREGRESESDFMTALLEEETRIENNWAPLWHYTNQWHYVQQLKRYYALFDKEQIQIHLYEDLRDTPELVLSKIFTFLGLDSEIQIDMKSRFNVSGKPRSRNLHRFMTKSNKTKKLIAYLLPRKLLMKIKSKLITANLSKSDLPPYTDEARLYLKDKFRSEIDELGSIVGRDLSAWMR